MKAYGGGRSGRISRAEQAHLPDPPGLREQATGASAEDEAARAALANEAWERRRERDRRRAEAHARAVRRRVNRASVARIRAALAADPSDPRHGTSSGYAVGCRCSRCKEAERERKARSKAKGARGEGERPDA